MQISDAHWNACGFGKILWFWQQMAQCLEAIACYYEELNDDWKVDL
jgi:hypothetical protein